MIISHMGSLIETEWRPVEVGSHKAERPMKKASGSNDERDRLA